MDWYETEIRRLAAAAGEPEAVDAIIDAIDEKRWEAERNAAADAESSYASRYSDG